MREDIEKAIKKHRSILGSKKEIEYFTLMLSDTESVLFISQTNMIITSLLGNSEIEKTMGVLALTSERVIFVSRVFTFCTVHTFDLTEIRSIGFREYGSVRSQIRIDIIDRRFNFNITNMNMKSVQSEFDRAIKTESKSDAQDNSGLGTNANYQIATGHLRDGMDRRAIAKKEREFGDVNNSNKGCSSSFLRLLVGMFLIWMVFWFYANWLYGYDIDVFSGICFFITLALLILFIGFSIRNNKRIGVEEFESACQLDEKRKQARSEVRRARVEAEQAFLQKLQVQAELEAQQVQAMLEEQRIYEESLIRSKVADIDRMNGYEFEEYLEVLFAQLGYVAEKTPASGDYGTDLLLRKDGMTIAVQAKRYKGMVGSPEIQKSVGGQKYYQANECWVVTTSYFTERAKEFANIVNVKLLNRNWLIKTAAELNDQKNDIDC